MKYFIYFLSGLTLLSFVACQTNSVTDDDELTAWEQENTEAIETVLEADDDLNFDAIDDGSEENFESDDPDWLASSTLGKTTAATHTRYGRIRTAPVERNVQIIFDNDSTATAYVYTKIEGDFIAVKAVVDSDSVSYQRFVKPMTHEVERVVHLKKVRDTEYERLNWKIIDISMKNGASPDNTVEIVKMEVMPANQDTTEITDPLAYFMDGVNMFTFPRWTDVRVRVTVSNTSANPMVYPEGTEATERVRLHYGRNRLGNHARTPLTWIGKDDMDNNIYEGYWTIKQFAGIHHAVIDVVDNGTVLSSDDESYPYNSNTWAIPYRVTVF